MCIGGVGEHKSILRERYKEVRKNMPLDEKDMMDEQIFTKLVSLDEYQKSRTILVYVSKGLEVSTHKIIEDAWSKNKRVAVPRCDVGPVRMDFYYIDSKNDLEEGYFGIYEPVESKSDMVKGFTEGLCIVPGLAFDEKGYRLGFGKGYYDRFLSWFKGFTVGICYSNCVTSGLPVEEHDKPVDILVTDGYIKRSADLQDKLLY